MYIVAEREEGGREGGEYLPVASCWETAVGFFHRTTGTASSVAGRVHHDTMYNTRHV